jgi:hypothetical protein
MSEPRKHHYVPASYLAGFTDTGRADGRLFVLDKGTGRQWESSPAKSGCERDFYMIEVAEDIGDDPQAVENFFSKVEGDSRDAIQATIRDGRVPEGAMRDRLIEFLALQATRVPGTLDGFDKFGEQLAKTVAWYLTATPDAWEAVMKQSKEDGEPPSAIPYEQIRDFVRSGEYSITWEQNTRLGLLLQALPSIASVLAARKWTLVVATRDCPDFVCSDRPLTLCWNDPSDKRGVPIGLGVIGTTAQFPLTRRAALFGMFEQPFPVAVANTQLVATTNMLTAWYSTRYVYSAGPDFRVALRDGSVAGRDAVVVLAAKQRLEG